MLEKSKRFFFEKKKQKTFALGGLLSRHGQIGHAREEPTNA
jgi:hypothetical protein